jgi:diguanylate cyclase (GGDEF)-like protein/PAS domain S-box-containing protein
MSEPLHQQSVFAPSARTSRALAAHARAGAGRRAGQGEGCSLPAIERLLAGQPAILLGCLLLVLWLVAGGFLQHVHDRTLEAAALDTGNLARAMAEEAQSSVLAVDRTLVDLRERWQEEPQNFAGKLRLRQDQLNESGSVWVSVVDADGRLVFTNTSAAPGRIDLSDRDYFRELRDAGADQLFISKPVTGRISGRRGVVFARPIRKDGRFAGVVVMSVSPEYFLRISRELALGPDSAVLLVRRGGDILARKPELAGRELPTLRDLPFAQAFSPLSGGFCAVSPVDGIERQYAWRTLPKHGLTISIGRALDQVLAPYHAARRAALWSAGLLSLVIVATGLVMLRGIREGTKELRVAEQAAREALAAENLFRSDQRFRQLADAMPQIVWTAEPDGTVDYGNRVATAYTGRSAMFGASQGWTEALHPDDVAPTLAAWGHAVASGEVLDHEYRLFRAADSSYRWHQVRALPIRDDGGAIVKWYGSATDIHDSKLALDHIGRMAANQATILESMTDAYYSLDGDWRFTYVNKEAERLIGRSRESLLGKCIWDEYPELDGSIIESEYHRAASHGCTASFEFYHAPTGCWFTVRATPTSEGLTVYFADVTERRRLRVFKDEQTRLLEQIAAGASLFDVLAAATGIVAASDLRAACVVMLPDEDGSLRYAVGTNVPDGMKAALDAAGAALPCGRAAQTRRPVVVGDLRTEAWWGEAGLAALVPKVRACLSYPILAGSGEVLGTIDMYSASGKASSAVELEILGSCAHTISIAMGRERAEQKARRLEYQADYDAVTGLASRSLLVERAGGAIAKLGPQGGQVWVACIDIDRLKMVNESLGHRAGDVALQLLAQRVQGLLGAGDMAARVASDELMLLFADGNDEHAVVSKVRRIMEAIAAPVPVGTHEFHLGSSVGIAAYPADGDDAETLMKNAHVAMCRAKEVRSNHLEFFTAAMNDRTIGRLRLECDLRHALERDELLLHFQPQVDAHSGRIVGMEALLRWKHPELGMVAPDRFIRIAEESGLIVPIGAWVVRSACAQAKRWQALVPGRLRVGVNLAASQLYHDDLVAMVGRTLAETGLEAACLDLELTESQVMADVDQALSVMQRLKALGVTLSLDDFGTGYSSLSYLKRFPIDVLKIDKSFVRNLPLDPDDAVIARSIISLAQSLQLQVIAEGVETREQFDYLRQHRCDQIQGYFFSRPLAAPDFERLLVETGSMLPA